MSINYVPYVPDYVARDINASPEAQRLGVGARFEVVTLFADVSGFTAISEALGKSGKIGTEELTQILNSYFEPMIQLIKTYGGIIGKFGGDAMTVLFPYNAETRAETVRRAIQCALDMQRDMVNYENIQTSRGAYSLAMKAGLGIGTVYTTLVGDPDIRLEFIIAGPPIDDCADAEHHATKGEVVTHNALLPDAPDAVIGEDRGDFSLITALGEPVERNPITPLDQVNEAAANVLRHFLHPIIAERVQSGNNDFIDEHRRTTVLFVSFTEMDYVNNPNIGTELQTYFDSIINIVHRYDGYVNKIDMGDKGSKFIVLFGAPAAHENDEERALRCALEIADVHGIKTRIGVNSGAVYCGRVGSALRREYTVMGDAVNLSARLMQFAKPGQIIVSGLTRDYLRGKAFTWEELDSIMVKGKTEPIEVARLLGVSAQQAIALLEPAYSLPMVGRKREIGQVRGLLAQARTGRGQIIGVQADAGMGKSRLNAEIIRIALEEGFAGYGGAAQSYNTALPFVVWQGVWRGFFALDPADSPARQISALEAKLADINADFVQRAPLLGPVLGLEIPDNAFTETLDAAMRTDLLNSLLLDCLRERSKETPLLLVLEDCHWMDPASSDLLNFIGRNLHNLPVLLVTLFRPPHVDGQQSKVQEAVGEVGHFTLFNLQAFDHDEAGELIALKLDQLFGGQHQVSDALSERIRQRAQGNPFYIEELINLLRDRDIDPTAAELAEFELPDSLQQLILSRIDNLREDEKTVIKIASIIGRVFRASWVYGSYPEVGMPQFVIERLDRLGDLELTPLDRPEPELEYLFRHLLTQEVAYGTMAFSVRSSLHERVAVFIENRYDDNLTRYLDVIAYHYGQSDNQPKQREYFRLAGDNARRTYAMQAAQFYYERLLPLLNEEQQGDVLLALGEVLQITGDWPTAEGHYRRAIELSGGDARLRARVETMLGDLLSYTATPDDSLQMLEAARGVFAATNDLEGLNRVLKHMSFVYLRQGDYDNTRAMAERQLEVARQLGDRVALAEAAQNLGLVEWFTGNLDGAMQQFESVIKIAEERGYLQGAIYAYSNMAGLHYGRGEFTASVEKLQNALETAQKIGYTRVIGGIIGNMGNIYSERGAHEQALACYQHALRVAVELGDWSTAVFALDNMATVYRNQQDLDEARRLSDRSIPLAEQMEAPFYLATSLMTRAEALLKAGDAAAALPIAERALSTAREVNNDDTAFSCALLLVQIRLALGQLDAEAAVQALEALRAENEGDPEQAALDYEIWRIQPQNQPMRDSAAGRYRSAFETQPRAEFARRYNELTGESLNSADGLPELPRAVLLNGTDRAELLAQVDARLN